MTRNFLALNDEQEAVTALIRAVPRGRLTSAWSSVTTVCDAATEAYMVLTGADAAERPLGAAGRNDLVGRATSEVERARTAIRQFGDVHRRALDEVRHALNALPAATHTAHAAVAYARSTVRRLMEQELPVRQAADRLGAAEAALVQTDDESDGPVVRYRAAGRAVEAAGQAAESAAEAPGVVSRVRGALSSIGVRCDVVEAKAGQVPALLSQLRREFSDACSRDLVGVDRSVRADLAAARDVLAQAEHHAGERRWDDAADDIAAARTALTRAEDGHRTVVARIEELRQVRLDPDAPAEEARFAVRDAQRLVEDRGLVEALGAALDAQSTRIEAALRRLSTPHPDFRGFLVELRDARERVAEVVAQARRSGGASRRPR